MTMSQAWADLDYESEVRGALFKDADSAASTFASSKLSRWIPPSHDTSITTTHVLVSSHEGRLGGFPVV